MYTLQTCRCVVLYREDLQVPDENVEAAELRVGAGGQGGQGHVRGAPEARVLHRWEEGQALLMLI